jgi:ergothioneine biosynthesis protein EgtB
VNPLAAPAAALAAASLAERFAAVRGTTAWLCEGLSAEDCQLQSMDDASPVKWHLAHTTWFFETFVLERALPGWQPVDPAYRVLFNSYYVGVGERHPRPRRGLLSRPSLVQVQAYREVVEQAVQRWLQAGDCDPALLALVELGLHHEQQHQELILTDLKHHFSCNPLSPAWRPAPAHEALPAEAPPLRFVPFDGGLVEIGHDGAGFAFDNESPRHRTWLEPYALADRLVTQGEYLQFMADGGYRRPALWLSAGWDLAQAQGWQAPLHWRPDGNGEGGWRQFTLHGERPLRAAEPVCHLSYFEADAYARWAGARLPTEAEWEHAAGNVDSAPPHAFGRLLDDGHGHPAPAAAGPGLKQLFGDCWEWTASAYLPYPGYRPAEGAVGEYNGKFMVDQMVLRGGSCATPRSHLRASYRNFFPTAARWQFSGVRLAR